MPTARGLARRGPRRAGTARPDRRGTGRHPGPGSLGGADGAGRTGRRGSGAAPGAGPSRAGGRAAAARRRAAPAGGAGRHAGVAARGQGAGVGCGVPGRAGRRHAADLARAGARPRQRAGRRRASPVLRRNHQSPSAFGAQLGAGAGPGRTSGPQAVAVPQRHRAADACRVRRRASPGATGARRPAAGSATTS